MTQQELDERNGETLIDLLRAEDSAKKREYYLDMDIIELITIAEDKDLIKEFADELLELVELKKAKEIIVDVILENL
jgi:phosphotransacetylase